MDNNAPGRSPSGNNQAEANAAGRNGSQRNSDRQQRHRNRRAINRNNLRSREGFFMHYLFVTLTVRYASYFKPWSRRLIEFFTLIKAIIMLLILIYVHVTFVKESGNCLEKYQDVWPRSGILKVQVEANTSLPEYQYFYAHANADHWAASFEYNPYQAVFKYSVQVGKNGLPKSSWDRRITPNDYLNRAKSILGLKHKTCPVMQLSGYAKKEARETLKKRFFETVPHIHFLHSDDEKDIQQQIIIDPSASDSVAAYKMYQMQDFSGFNVGPQPVRDYYAIEYSSEFGYLRLSSATRYKLGIPVLVVTLDPLRDSCFGKGTKQWMLDTFFGYDDLIMSSIKSLVEKDDNRAGGFLRNLVTGEHYKFITLWVSHASYILAFAVMLVFTLVVTMLLRYSYHQIFVFMVELLHILDTDASPVFPAAPMLTIILALVGTEEIMTEFFHDSTLAFYVILSIWIADQFDAICMHTVISRRHWVRFFYLYHFAFYAYHYRFNGQFSELALFTSWLFMQHSMFYFLHHYEIPAIERQIRLRQIFFQNNTQNTPPSPPSPESSNTPSPSAQSDDSSPSDENDLPGGSNDERFAGESSDGSPSGSGNSASEADDEFLLPNDGYGIEIHHLDAGISPSHFSDAVALLPTENNNILSDNDVIKDDAMVLWEELSPIFSEDELVEREVVRTSVGLYKYCSVFMILFFAVIALILVFLLTILMLNQGRYGARSPLDDFGKVAGIVR